MASSLKSDVKSEHSSLRFQSVDECAAFVNRVIATSDAGTLRVAGNWTPGEIMSHVANWINYAYDGFPIPPAPFFVRWILRFRLRKMLRDGMPRGVRIPGVKGGTVGMEDIGTVEAAKRLLDALNRLKSDEVARFNSPAFGALSHEDRIALNLRHAELHLGFLVF